MKKIRFNENHASGEWKELAMTGAPAEQMIKHPKYPERYIIKWQWKNRKPNQKSFWDEEKAERFYECIDIDGWPDAA